MRRTESKLNEPVMDIDKRENQDEDDMNDSDVVLISVSDDLTTRI